MNEDSFMDLYYEDFDKALEWVMTHRYVCFPMENTVYRLDDEIEKAVISSLLKHHELSIEDVLAILDPEEYGSDEDNDEFDDVTEELQEIFEGLGLSYRIDSKNNNKQLYIDTDSIDLEVLNEWIGEAGYEVIFYGSSGS